MLQLKNIAVTLGRGTTLERKVLSGLNLAVPKGEFIVVIGGNGAGKSTMFEMISGFVKPQSGCIILDGEDVTSQPQTLRARSIARVLQDPRLGTMENMTIFENLAFALNRGKTRAFKLFSSNARRQLFAEKLFALDMGLENRLDEVTGNLSGGQRQALSLIMAILADSKVLLLDEITAALDPKTAKKVMKLANTIVRSEGKTCLMITHSMEQALEYGDRTLILKGGKFIKEYRNTEKKMLSPEQLAAAFEA